MKRLNDYIFGYGSPLTLGIYRAVIGFLSMVNVLFQWPFAEDWYGPNGFVPLRVIEQFHGDVYRWQPLNYVDSMAVTHIAFAIWLISSITTMLGYKTRISTIVLALTMVAFNHRNPMILNSGDTLLRQSLWILAVAPCGNAFSLDRYFKFKKGEDLSQWVSLWPQRMVQWQMAIVYGTTVWHKLTGTTWAAGTAAWFPTRLSEFHRFPFPEALDAPPFTQFVTYYTLAIEVALATLVFWRPARKWVLIGGLLLHAMIEYRMNIPLFGFVMTAQYLSFIESNEWKNWRPWRKFAPPPERSQLEAA